MYYNISFDIAAILVLIVLSAGMNTVLYTETRGHRLVCIYMYSVIACAIIDIITAYTICYGYMVPDTLNLILNTVFQYATVLCVSGAMRIILNYYPGASRTSVMVNRVLIYLLTAFVTLNIFTGWLFKFENGVYIHGNLYIIAYILPLLIVFHMLFVVLINRNDQPGIITRIVIFFLFLPTIFTVIQMIAGDILLVAFGEAFSTLVILFAMETPDYRKLMKTMKELEAAREEANVANRSKSDFLAGMSHEIRTPINGILGMNTMILRDSKDPKITEYAENIRVSGNGLLSIVNDILDLTKIESGRMDIIPADYELFSILNECYQMNRMRASEKGLEFTIENDPYMPSAYFGDEVRIRQIINNLISNGVKYTKNGSVRVKAGFIKDDVPPDNGDIQGSIVISVTDTGIGIKKEDLDNLFERFTRLEEKRNRNIEGTGLGLHISKLLISMMNGRIEVDSEYGQGSEFTVYIPQRVMDKKPIGDFNERLKEQVKVSKDSASPLKAPGKRVLIVDDVKMNIIVFKGLLRDSEMTIDSALSGPESIEMTKKNKYDIIFMDHLMPKMDGIEAFHIIRDDKDNLNCNTPFVALTANAIVGVRETYISEGFTEYLSKPVEYSDLLTVTGKLLNNTTGCEGDKVQG